MFIGFIGIVSELILVYCSSCYFVDSENYTNFFIIDEHRILTANDRTGNYLTNLLFPNAAKYGKQPSIMVSSKSKNSDRGW